MGRTPLGLNRGPWTHDEDLRLRNYIEAHGEGGWRTLPVKAGLYPPLTKVKFRSL